MYVQGVSKIGNRTELQKLIIPEILAEIIFHWLQREEQVLSFLMVPFCVITCEIVDTLSHLELVVKIKNFQIIESETHVKDLAFLMGPSWHMKIYLFYYTT